MSEQGVQEGTKHTPLRGPRVEDQRGRCVVAYPYHLGVRVGYLFFANILSQFKSNPQNDNLVFQKYQ
jgi:hypothetical protein